MFARATSLGSGYLQRNCQLPKLDDGGSSPLSRSIFSAIYKELLAALNPLFEVTRYPLHRKLLIRSNFTD